MPILLYTEHCVSFTYLFLSFFFRIFQLVLGHFEKMDFPENTEELKAVFPLDDRLKQYILMYMFDLLLLPYDQKPYVDDVTVFPPPGLSKATEKRLKTGSPYFGDSLEQVKHPAGVRLLWGNSSIRFLDSF